MKKETIDRGMFRGARVSIKALEGVIISGTLILSAIILYYILK